MGNSHLPAFVDVAIVGGGIIGVSTAYALACEGASVAVFEKGTLGCEQSSRNWGWVRTLMRDLSEVPLALRSQQVWKRIQDQVDVGFRQNGILYLARSDKEMGEYRAWLDKARRLGVQASLLSPDEVASKLPHSSQRWAGGLYAAGDGVAEPTLATVGIARLARKKGVHIYEQCAARGVSMVDGAVSLLHTEKGPVSAKNVLVAGGAWSRLFCGNMGVSLPQMRVRASVLRTAPVSSAFDVALNGRTFTCRPRMDGGYTISQFNASYADIVPDSFRLLRHFLPSWLKNSGLVKLRFGKSFFREMAVKRRFAMDEESPFERVRVLNPKPARDAVASSLKKLASDFPVFKDAEIADMWGGYIDVTPDALPIMCEAATHKGLFIATGFSGHGFGIGPAVGEAMADLISRRRPAMDVSPFGLERFR